jgi:phosphatidylserine/phosphatidylglycerophosphate/cardiolipin synthase-like enzyme
MLTCKTHSQAEVFVGTSAGSPLYHDIKEAKLSVRVVSPYLGDHLVEVLLGCQEHGVDVRAIVSNDFGNARDLARLLVVQTTQLDTDRQRLSRYGSLFGAVTLPVALGLLSWGVLERSGAVIAAAVLLGLLAFLLVLFFQKLAIYVYSYSYRLDGLRVVPSPRCYPYGTKESAPPFVHAKLYVIDDRVAYLGSANFTRSGLFDNLEAMVRLTSPDAVAALGRYVDDLFAGSHLPAYPPEVWARQFFREHRGMVTASSPRPVVPIAASTTGT